MALYLDILPVMLRLVNFEMDRLVPEEHIKAIKTFIINNPNNRSVSDIYSGVGPVVTYNEIHLYLKMFGE